MAEEEEEEEEIEEEEEEPEEDYGAPPGSAPKGRKSQLEQELKQLVEIARDARGSFIIEGSVGRRLAVILKDWPDHTPPDELASVFDLVSPLSDIDIRCPRNRIAAIRGAISERFPVSRFHHIEFRAVEEWDEPPYNSTGTVVVESAPSVAFSWTERIVRLESRAKLIFKLDNDGELKKSEGNALPKVFLDKKRSRAGTESAIEAFLDLLFLCRLEVSNDPGETYSFQKQDIQYVAGDRAATLKSASPERLFEEYLLHPGKALRLRSSLLKYACRRLEELERAIELRDLIPEDFIRKLSGLLSGGVASELLLRAGSPSAGRFEALVCPKRLNGAWVRDVEWVGPETPSSLVRADQRNFLKNLQRNKKKVDVLDHFLEGGVMSPIFTLETEDPPDPDCCVYEDFSRGVAEILWSGSGFSGEQSPLFALVRSRKVSGHAVAHAVLNIGAVNSARLDYGYLCTIAGSKGRIEIAAAAQNPTSQEDSEEIHAPSSKQSGEGTVKVFLVHGIMSHSKNLEQLQTRLSEDHSVFSIDYDWIKPVLDSGLEIAKEVMENSTPSDKVFLVGHSQGGLVARVAAVALNGRLKTPPPGGEGNNKFYDDKKEALKQYRGLDDKRLKGVVMLATPNNGALTFGQLSTHVAAAAFGIKQILKRGCRVDDLADLTTDRLQRVLQHFEMGAEVKYLSISGSAVNRFGTVSKLSVEALAAFGASLASNFGVHLEKPNDIIVEDASVDLSNATLPPEFSEGTIYEHVRSYVDCVDVGHTSIHKDPHVIDLLRNWISKATLT